MLILILNFFIMGTEKTAKPKAHLFKEALLLSRVIYRKTVVYSIFFVCLANNNFFSWIFVS